MASTDVLVAQYQSELEERQAFIDNVLDAATGRDLNPSEMELVTLTPAIRAERGIRSAQGALVYRASERITAQLGMAPGDVIVMINRTPVTSAEDVSRALDYYAGRGLIRVFYEHEGQIYPTDFWIP